MTVRRLLSSLRDPSWFDLRALLSRVSGPTSPRCHFERGSQDTRYWLGLGSNLGDPTAQLRTAVDRLARLPDIALEAVSDAFSTSPRELADQPPYLNAAARCTSGLAPPELLAAAKELERELGRTAGPRFGPRVIDCDLLLWSGGEWRAPDLEIPHPRLAERRFALVPLLDLDPDLELPDGRRLAALERALDAGEQRVERRAEVGLRRGG